MGYLARHWVSKNDRRKGITWLTNRQNKIGAEVAALTHGHELGNISVAIHMRTSLREDTH